MDDELIRPWIILGGYALTYLCFHLAVKAVAMADGGGHDRWRAIAAGLCTVGGLVGSSTTFFWFSHVIHPVVLIVVPALFTVGVVVLLRWYASHQHRWMTRLAGEVGGVVHTADSLGRPSFGVVPVGGTVTSDRDQRRGYDRAIEFDRAGRRVLGIGYVLHPREPAGGWRFGGVRPGRSFGNVARLANRNYLVQVSTPAMSTVVITPRTNMQRRAAFGADDPFELGPLLESRVGRNVAGALRPDDELTDVPTGDAVLDRLFVVSAADPGLVGRLFAGEVAAALRRERWLRLGQIGFQDGVLWTVRFGGLTQERLFEAADQLAALAALAPAAVWRPRDDAGWG